MGKLTKEKVDELLKFHDLNSDTRFLLTTLGVNMNFPVYDRPEEAMKAIMAEGEKLGREDEYRELAIGLFNTTLIWLARYELLQDQTPLPKLH